MPEDRYEEWAESRRNEFRQLYLALAIELARLHEGRGEHTLAIEALRKAISEEPALEEAHAFLMRLHSLSGRSESALAQYERLREALRKDIGTRPTEAPRRLRDEIVAGRLSTATPDGPPKKHEEKSTGASKHNIPAQRSSFVGREREMVEVKRSLAMTRLLTLTGAARRGGAHAARMEDRGAETDIPPQFGLSERRRTRRDNDQQITRPSATPNRASRPGCRKGGDLRVSRFPGRRVSWGTRGREPQ